MTFGFCPSLESRRPLCKGEGSHFKTSSAQSLQLLPATRLSVPWFALEATGACPGSASRAFVEAVGSASWMALPASGSDTRLATAYARLQEANVAATLAPAPASLADLPLIELPSATPGPRFAVLLSGDGGWAKIDKEIAAALQRRGISVIGFDSLRYFWSKRTPEGLAADLDRLLRYYARRFTSSQALLIGYSQGADVLPFAINRLPPASRALVRYTALLGLGQKAAFEFHISNWLGPSGDHPIAPEAQKLSAEQTLCVHGSDEKASLCPSLAPAHVQAVQVKGDHHFNGDYEGVTALIVARSAK